MSAVSIDFWILSNSNLIFDKSVSISGKVYTWSLSSNNPDVKSFNPDIIDFISLEISEFIVLSNLFSISKTFSFSISAEPCNSVRSFLISAISVVILSLSSSVQFIMLSFKESASSSNVILSAIWTI